MKRIVSKECEELKERTRENIVRDIKIRRLGWPGRIIGMWDERVPKKVINGKFLNTRPVGKPKTRWEGVVRRKTSQIVGIRWRRYGQKVEAFYEGSQIQEGAVVP